MSYMHIDNLYKAQEILEFKHCYALEKIHGTSAHISWKGKLEFSSGGETHERFVSLFDQEGLTTKFVDRFGAVEQAVVFGEAYGGRCQGMSKTYGQDLKFVVFEVKVNDTWLAVPQAAEIATYLGLEFVDYALITTEMAAIDAERDRPSTQAIRNGIVEPRIREGIVLRPPFEVRLSRGDRVIAKYKREEFAERARPRVDVDPGKRAQLEGAEALAAEWVTAMRLEHVIDALVSERANKDVDLSDTPLVIRAMIEDILREARGEFEDRKPVRKAMGARAVKLFKLRLGAKCGP